MNHQVVHALLVWSLNIGRTRTRILCLCPAKEVQKNSSTMNEIVVERVESMHLWGSIGVTIGKRVCPRSMQDFGGVVLQQPGQLASIGILSPSFISELQRVGKDIFPAGIDG